MNRLPKKAHEIGPIVFNDPHSKVFQCPCCNARLQFKVKVDVLGVYELGQSGEVVPKPIQPPSVVKDALNPAERELIESLRSSGVLQAFENAVRADPVSNVKDIERYLITFLTRAVPMKSPQFAIRQCLPDDEAAGNLELWGLNKTVAVLANGEFRAFIPMDIIRGKPLSSLKTSNGSIKKTEELTVAEWVRTRHGYVVGRGMLFTEMRKRAAGSFANTGI